MAAGSSAKTICCRMASVLQEILEEAEIDDGHGIDHALNVLNHAENTLAVSKLPKTPQARNAVLYAALLHDADDRKFFPDSTNHDNTRRILETVLPGETATHDLVVHMIELVSCSSNGNSLEGVPEGKEWMLIPRLCDRLEASGSIGVLRAWIYTENVGRPLFTKDTPRAQTPEELETIATPEKFDNYLRVKQSVSMMDHFYDKILHITSPEAILFDNPYLRREAQERHDYIVDFVLRFGRTGSVDRRVYNKVRAAVKAQTKAKSNITKQS